MRARTRSKAIAAAICLLSALHALSVVEFLMPESPIRQVTHSTSAAYVDRFWWQSWHLFSPDPPTSDSHLNVRCTYADGTKTPWLDAAELAVGNAFTWMVGPAPKLRYVHTGVHNQAISVLATAQQMHCGAPPERGDEEELVRFESCVMRHQAAIDAAFTASEPYEHAVAFGESICAAATETAAEITRTELRSMERMVYPYSKRHAFDPAVVFRARVTNFPSFEGGIR